MRAAVDANNSGLILTPRCSSRYPEVRLPDLDYADDIALFEDSDLKMANTTEAIHATAGKLGLKMSFKKTEILPIGHSCTTPSIVPLGDEGNIKVVQHFKYLGACCSADGTNTKELNHRVGKAAGAFKRTRCGVERSIYQFEYQDEVLQCLRTIYPSLWCWMLEPYWKGWSQTRCLWYAVSEKDLADYLVTT